MSLEFQMRWSILSFVALTGCSTLADTVTMRGNVRDDIPEEAGPFAGASLQVLDENGKKTLAKGKANAKGDFSIEIPGGTPFHVLVDGEGHVPASFSGVSGLQDKFEVEDGTLHGVRQDEWDAWLAAFAGCPGAGEGGGAVIGEPRVLELQNEGEHPGAASAVAELWISDAEDTIPACYLDPETGLYSPDAAATGAQGVFAIFGVPEGVYVLSVGFQVMPDAWTWEDTVVYVPDGGVAPRFPAWVHFPVR